MATTTTRFMSEHMFFGIEGHPFYRGNRTRKSGLRNDEFKNLLKLSAKTAMSEFGWECTADAVYIIIILYIRHTRWSEEPRQGKEGRKKTTYAQRRAELQSILVTQEPRMENILKVILNTLEGSVFKKKACVTASLVVKRYSTEPRIEIVIGKPKTYKELAHDIRNA